MINKEMKYTLNDVFIEPSVTSDTASSEIGRASCRERV